MREIKFRGKIFDNNEWIYGDLIHVGNSLVIQEKSISCSDIIYTPHLVIKETVGQFTGIKDKNENDIYEGDICMFKDKFGTVICKVVYIDNHFCGIGYDSFEFTNLNMFTIIGKIHDNKELLK